MSLADTDYDLVKLQKSINGIIRKLFTDPAGFAATFWTTQKKGIFRRRIETFSPYFKTNEVSLCCLIGKTSVPEEQWPQVCVLRVPNVTEVKAGPRGQVLKVPDGRTYALKVARISNLSIQYSDKPPTSLKNVKAKEEKLLACSNIDVDNLVYLGSDAFTNDMLISYLLDFYYNSKLNTGGLGGYLKVYEGNVCDSKSSQHGVLLTEYVEFQSIDKWANSSTAVEAGVLELVTRPFGITEEEVASFSVFTTPVILDIVKQVIANLKFLQDKLQFNHGDLKIENILVNNQSTSIAYNKMRYSSKITFKLSDFER